jgi:hypothetical protein
MAHPFAVIERLARTGDQWPMSIMGAVVHLGLRLRGEILWWLARSTLDSEGRRYVERLARDGDEAAIRALRD